MSIWPWGKAENRQSNYSTDLVNLLTQRAAGATAKAETTGALEAAAGLIGRTFAAAEVSGPTQYVAALTPTNMMLIGRELIRRGEVLFVIDLDDNGMVDLLPCSSYDVQGDTHAASWRYRCNMSAPSMTYTRENVTRDGVVWIPYATEPTRPWRGVAPLQAAALAGRLSAETLSALGDESSSPRGYLLPLPVAGDSDTVTQLRNDLKSLRGQLATVETMSAGWDAGEGAAARTEWGVRRLGSFVPQPLVDLNAQASREVLAACGCSPSLFGSGDGTSAREAYRQLLFSTVMPLGKIMEAELRARLHEDIKIDFTELRASDIQGRSRAFSALTKGGFPVAEAAVAAGFPPIEAPVPPPEPGPPGNL